MPTFLWHQLTPKFTWPSQNKPKKNSQKIRGQLFPQLCPLLHPGGGIIAEMTVHNFKLWRMHMTRPHICPHWYLESEDFAVAKLDPDFALLLLMAASLRMAMAGVLTGVRPAAGVLAPLGGSLEMVRVTTCMCSPSCFSPLWYCLRRLRNLAK